MKINKKCFFASRMGLALVGIFLVGQANAAVYTLSGVMDPAQATTNPANVGSGTGTISGTYDDVSNLLNYSIDWMNLTAAVTNMHFHVGAIGVPGGVDLGIPGPWSSPEIGTDVALGGPQEANLLAGNWYVNVHTLSYAGGEIRGQVIVNAVPLPPPPTDEVKQIPTMSAYGLVLTMLGLMFVAVRRLRTPAKRG